LTENTAARPEKKSGTSFSEILKDSIQKVGELEKQANTEVESSRRWSPRIFTTP